MGLHLNIPDVHSADREMREHRKRLWWTAYIFDRLWASKMGHPVTIQDDDVEVDRPSLISGTPNHEDFGDHEYLIASIQLAKLAGRITASIYSRRRQQGSFSQRVQYSLKELTNWVEHMPNHLQIQTDSVSNTASDAIISLHLLFNQVSSISLRSSCSKLIKIVRDSSYQTSLVACASQSYRDIFNEHKNSPPTSTGNCIGACRSVHTLRTTLVSPSRASLDPRILLRLRLLLYSIFILCYYDISNFGYVEGK